MGKATKWFRGLLGLKKSEPNPDPAQKPSPKKKWSFGRNSKGKDRLKSRNGGDSDEDASRHAIAVASATAAVAEAAVAAAQAAAAVVKLTSGGGSTGSSGGLSSAAYVSRRGARNVNREEWAAVMIQSHFRAYLSRRALRALRALVKLQALVRGHIMRKRWANYLRQMQAMIRAQARARAGRALISEPTNLNMKSPPSPEMFERIIQNRSMKKPEQLIRLKRNGSKSNGNIIYDHEKSNPCHHRMTGRSWDEKAEKILEVDTGRPLAPPARRNISRSSHLSHSSDKYCQTTTAFSSSSGEVQSLSPLIFAQKDKTVDEGAFWTAENSPQFYSASSVGGSTSQRGAFTPPTKSLSGYSDHPNYMAYTASSKAKVRSLSAPKQRQTTQYERSSSTNRYSVHGYGDLRSNPQKKCYPGSGRLDGFGFPVEGGDYGRFSSGHWIRY